MTKQPFHLDDDKDQLEFDLEDAYELGYNEWRSKRQKLDGLDLLDIFDQKVKDGTLPKEPPKEIEVTCQCLHIGKHSAYCPLYGE